MFVAVMALTFGVEIVVFSPARRASRKLLERMQEVRLPDSQFRRLAQNEISLSLLSQFVNVLDMGHKIVEYNQENLRITSLEGGSSLIRSFPSKVSVRAVG